MIKGFPIDFVRQVIEQTLFNEKNFKPNDYFGGSNEVSLFTFYEQLQTQEEVDRYVEKYRDLTKQQNRTGLIANGVLLSPENPTITNINQKTNIPLTFACSFRVQLKNRDKMLATLNNLIQKLKGRKVDVAEFSNGQLLMVGTIANNSEGSPNYDLGAFLGTRNYDVSLDTFMANVKADLTSKGITYRGLVYPYMESKEYFYYRYSKTTAPRVVEMRVVLQSGLTYTDLPASDENKDKYPYIVFPPMNTGYERYQVSMTFDSIKVDEPNVLNAEEYCVVSLGGSATISSASLMLGNQITKLVVSKYKIKGSTDFTYSSNEYYLEPLEFGSGNGVNLQMKQIVSNGFLTNEHADNITPTLQYSFLIDRDIPILKQWFEYARYGVNGVDNEKVSPNTIYKVTEYISAWGEVERHIFYTKINDSIDIENTESDTLTITIPMKIQGEN